MSSRKLNDNQLLCYECACFYEPENIQTTACSICSGRKCFMHGGQNTYTCKHCKTNLLCIDCLSFAKCCHEYDGHKFIFVGPKFIT